MLRLSAYAAVLAGALATPALALPALTVAPADSALIVHVYGGCGPYAHRGPYGGCRPGGQAGGYVPYHACPPGWHIGPYGARCWRN